MKIKFKKIKLTAEELYEGVIRKVEFDKVSRRVRIFTELDKVEGETFLKSLPYSVSVNSPTGRFFEAMGAMDEDGIVDLEELVGHSVHVTLNQGKNSAWYVNEMYLDEEDEEYEEAEDEEIFGDEE